MSLHADDKTRLKRADDQYRRETTYLAASVAKPDHKILHPVDVAELKILSDRIDVNLGRIEEIKRQLDDQQVLLRELIVDAEQP